MKRSFSYVFIALFAVACGSSTKEKINKVGDVTGQAVGQFVAGVSHGVEKAIDVHVELPAGLASKGIKFGKSSVTSDSSGSDNLLLLYVIFDQDFSGQFTAKAFDNKNQEMGRASQLVSGKKNEARFFEFHFGERTNIDSDSRLTVE